MGFLYYILIGFCFGLAVGIGTKSIFYGVTYGLMWPIVAGYFLLVSWAWSRN